MSNDKTVAVEELEREFAIGFFAWIIVPIATFVAFIIALGITVDWTLYYGGELLLSLRRDTRG